MDFNEKISENEEESKYLLTFSEEIIPNSNLRQIYFDLKNSKYLINGSHEVYEYLYENENLIYIFEGFYQDNYLIIICDIFDKVTKTRVESKDVFVIPIEWKYVKYNNIMRWTLDVQSEIFTKVFKINIRKRINEIPFIKNFIENTDYEELYIKIKRYDAKFTKDVITKKVSGLYEKINKFNIFK